MLKTLSFLSGENRLRIPLQVIKEFSANRPKELILRINDLEVIISGLQAQKPLNEKVPILEGKEIYVTTEKLQTQFNNSLKDYRQGLVKLRDELKELFNNDTYLEKLQEIVTESFFYSDDQKTVDELIKEAEKRFKNKIPPGYKDNSKEDNSAGDFIIWDSILHLNSDVIFISGDKKADWVYTDKHGNPVSARRELIEEFFVKTNGKDFAYLSPKEFITLLNPDVSETIKEDLSLTYTKYEDNSEKFDLSQNTIRKISKALMKYDPIKIILDHYAQLDEYDYEAEVIFESFESCGTIEGLETLVNVTLNKMFATNYEKGDLDRKMILEIWLIKKIYMDQKNYSFE